MKGKYWYTLFFILAFLVLFSTACIFYLNFNPIDKDTLKQSQATDLIYIFSGVSTLLAPLVILFTLSDWKNERQFDKKMEIYDQILTDCEKLNSAHKIKWYFSAEKLKGKTNTVLLGFERNNFIRIDTFDPGSLINFVTDFNNSYIDDTNSIYIFEIYRNLLNKITILQAMKSHQELSTKIGSILSLINSKKVQYAEFIDFFNQFNNKEISYDFFKSQVLIQNIFNVQNNDNNQTEILGLIQQTREIVRDELKMMMN